ncbi:MAG TPA: hypothetical protein VF059_13415 [Casimicrobiaceae bacterium]
MSVTEKMLDGITKVILMNERLKGVTAAVAGHQQRLENLTERIVRLETALEIGLSSRGGVRPARVAGRVERKASPDDAE